MFQSTKEMLVAILEVIVDHPEALEVIRTEDARGSLLTVKCHDEDMGRILGRQGQTIRSIRTIMHAAGNALGDNPSIKVEEDPERRAAHFASKPKEVSPDIDVLIADLDM